uniref:Uncharacterized protein n=1 Tax=Chromera velia CCMP2878 TaxID=1169474 RepID=A0A0G4GU50_9ALVE|eukprot:Cvel_23388.t1-p1 / transcript=Cvel_23388.t1 / gene=Cvel_23388 / organism=Chromera_velia_CCMP2878 / gene_product=hypothetical protein / transcript_product=hypothetical protein / location=Cvel_scaffold2404:7428-8096(-) / protein_length=124 / sequence_SO=supercontig / SO=protein_coding / is_pseudo=false
MPAPLTSIQILRGGSTLIIYPIFIFRSPFYESRLRTPQHPGHVNVAAREGGQRERGGQREKGGLRLLRREGGRKERPLGGLTHLRAFGGGAPNKVLRCALWTSIGTLILSMKLSRRRIPWIFSK